MSTEGGPEAALSAADHAFHEAYSAARDHARNDVPVLVVLATELALYVHGERREYSFARPCFQAAKAAAHAAVALFTLTSEPTVSEKARIEALEALEQRMRVAANGPHHSVDAAVRKELTPVLETSLAFVSAYLKGERAEANVAAYAAAVGPQILSLTEVTTCEQLAALHEAAQRALGSLSEADSGALQVVVIGDHQARVRSMGMQYFQRRFGERPESADERVTFGENVSNEKEALALVSTRRLDEKIARAFFGDGKRLQRDVLGDAAKRCIEKMNLAPVR